MAPRRIASRFIFFLEAALVLRRPAPEPPAAAFANHQRAMFTAKKAATRVPNRAMTAEAGFHESEEKYREREV